MHNIVDVEAMPFRRMPSKVNKEPVLDNNNKKDPHPHPSWIPLFVL
mgnify:CR=1 FL=1